ncbi:MAG: ferritin family protein [Candidatus Marinimicrobia bacterium]|nr:ferritin family protein [Candidatus Neomarinimicrobiota bacterium]
MKAFNVKEIIEYAIKIEKESFAFYSRASGNVRDAGVFGDLRRQEQGHARKIEGRMKKLEK